MRFLRGTLWQSKRCKLTLDFANRFRFTLIQCVMENYRQIWALVLRFAIRRLRFETGGCIELANLVQTASELVLQPTFSQHPRTPVEAAFREQAELRLNELLTAVRDLDDRRLVFESTETWRVVYEQVLQSVKSQRYLSVAVVRSEEYWRDKPARESLDFNFKLIKHGFHVHRIFIIDDFFWAPTASRPVIQLYDWIMDQASYGMEVSLLRKSVLDEEVDLICDFGIYGEEAIGIQQTDFLGKTKRFEISFDHQSVKEAEDRWRKLLLYATSLEKI